MIAQEVESNFLPFLFGYLKIIHYLCTTNKQLKHKIYECIFSIEQQARE